MLLAMRKKYFRIRPRPPPPREIPLANLSGGERAKVALELGNWLVYPK